MTDPTTDEQLARIRKHFLSVLDRWSSNATDKQLVDGIGVLQNELHLRIERHLEAHNGGK